MGVTQSHDDDGAPPPGPHPSNFQGTPDWRRPMGTRPTNSGNLPINYEPSNPLTGFRPTLQQVEARDPIQRSAIVTNVVNLHKNSLRLISSPESPSRYQLQFSFDAQVDGFITVYFCAQQIISRINNSTSPAAPVCKLSYTVKGDHISSKTPFSIGDDQKYNQNDEEGLDFSQFSTAELQRVENDRYPIVIRIEADYSSVTDVPPEEQVQSQVTFASFVMKDGKYEPKLVAQQVLVNGTIYKIHELYGIGGRDVSANLRPTDNYYDECVVCLTEPCTIAVEPCNHLCLCEDCATTLGSAQDRNMRKCPVCRSELVRLLPFVPPLDRSVQSHISEISRQSQASSTDSTVPSSTTENAKPDDPQDTPTDSTSVMGSRPSHLQHHPSSTSQHPLNSQSNR